MAEQNMRVDMFLITAAMAKDYDTRVRRWYEAWKAGIIDADTALKGMDNEKPDLPKT